MINETGHASTKEVLEIKCLGPKGFTGNNHEGLSKRIMSLVMKKKPLLADNTSANIIFMIKSFHKNLKSAPAKSGVTFEQIQWKESLSTKEIRELICNKIKEGGKLFVWYCSCPSSQDLLSLNSISHSLWKMKKALNETIFFVLGQTNLRTTGTDLTNPNAALRLQKMRPSSTNYISWGKTSELVDIYRRASSANILKK
ncbi:unnamed protein product [Lepeophtheirus salmonis]|uniref:(salmon louse) hypothetical protein n=1 Tax=Lepeophtheirus salmonis TaxID=72036 RepID=A0A7R8CM42_LEPSM|nr:unnamed protein product [Lepeophtheirus salmonis]CAF2863127.1 unnamed protein product [Lepeophtheirus salmonis]